MNNTLRFEENFKHGSVAIWSGPSLKAGFLKFLIISISTLSGCAPIYQRIRPDMEFQLRDVAGATVKSATAVITTRANPFDRLKNQESFVSNDQGVISIESQRRWKMVLFVVDGSDSYFWPWCIQAPGFRRIEGRVWGDGDVTIDGRDERLERSKPLSLVLEKSGSPSECFLYPKESFR